ncbi:Retrovirus-related Pol polyprotein from transposon TNT 1-94 [Ceratobasidium sp. AG-Ba]|nr:Retrovirus-related Pol polyprotein from transposon TNT 1-94 [Ceratobasidium sp. AG-Ba]QRV89279.1 Retrovirus-related Pol polyprotein from transposon TNT 1-94 [Ceratobasidium sp. AG-Ba]
MPGSTKGSSSSPSAPETSVSVGSTSSGYRIPVLSGTGNWRAWKVRMEDMFGELEVWEVVSGDETEPSDTSSTDAKDWRKKDKKALGIMRRCVNDSILLHILASTSSKQAWDTLVQTYQVTDLVSLVDLRRRLFWAKMDEGTPIDDHIRYMRSTYDELRAINDDLSNDFDWALCLISSLPSTWSTFIQTLTPKFNYSKKTEWTKLAEDVTKAVIAEGQRRQHEDKVESGLYVGKAPAGKQGGSGSGGGKEKKKKGKCRYCNKEGHWEAECRKKKRDQDKKETAHVAETLDDMSDNEQGYVYTFVAQGETGHRTETLAYTSHDEQDHVYSFVARGTSVTKSDWIADTGAESHIISDRSLFHSYTPSTSLVGGIGGDARIAGRGSVKAIIRHGKKESILNLTNCMHVPSFSGNLLSIGYIDSTGKGWATFKGGKCTLYDMKDRVIGVGPEMGRTGRGRLYRMDMEAVLPSDAQAHVAVGTENGRARSWEEWHRVYGHIGQRSLETLMNSGMVDGMKVDMDSPKDYFCEACVQGMQRVAPFPKESKTVYKAVGDLVVTDVWGPARTTSLQGNKYYVSFTDMYSRFTWIGFMKSTKEVLDNYKAFESLLKTQLGKSLKRVRSDNGKEYVNSALKSHAASQGTILEETAPHSSAQNGVAERLNLILVGHARAALAQHSLPKFLWQEAIAHITFLKNRSPTRPLKGVTPIELFTGQKPNVLHLQEFGAKCWVLDQSGKTSKLEPRSKKYHFMGFADNSRAWRYWKPETRQILKSRNVIFPPPARPHSGGDDLEAPQDEQEIFEEPATAPAEGESKAEQQKPAVPPSGRFTPPPKSAPQATNTQPGVQTSSQTHPNPSQATNKPPAGQSSSLHVPKAPQTTNTSSTVQSSSTQVKNEPNATKPLDAGSSSSSGSRLGLHPLPWSGPNAPRLPSLLNINPRPLKLDTRSISLPTTPAITPLGSPSASPTMSGIPLPRSHRAVPRPDYARLNECGKDTEDNDTGYRSKYAKPIGIAVTRDDEIEEEWKEYAYTAIKAREDDDHPSYEQSLSRWDAEAWSQARDEELANLKHMDTFELVDLPPGRKPLKAGWVNVLKRDADGVATRYRARVIVKGYGQRAGIDFAEITAHVLRSDSWRLLVALAAKNDWDLHQLDVEEVYMEQIPGYEDGTNRVLRLRGSLYGLKQAPRVWLLTFGKKVIDAGYTQLESEPSVFIQRDSRGRLAILAVYVDDIAVFTTKGYVQEVKAELMKLFKMRDMGELGHYLGYRVTRDRKEKTITLTLDTYTKNMVERAGLADAKPNSLPLPAGTQLDRYNGPPLNHTYQQDIGSLLYAALATRPDTAWSVQHLSQFSSNPGPRHKAGVKSLYRYLKGTSAYGITYHGKLDDNQPVGYSNADWAQNILDRKSISGLVFMFCGGAISWVSKKQPTIALSSMEGEYMALSLAIRHALWLRSLFWELGFPMQHPMSIRTDNTAAIALAKDPQYHGRSKHIDIRHHFIREQITRKRVDVSHISGEQNLADLFTKALPKHRHQFLTNSVMGRILS